MRGHSRYSFRTRTRRTRLAVEARTLVVILAAVSAACSDPYVPPSLQGIRLESGDQQTGVVGGPLADPLVVSAFNQLDEPIAGARVEFSASSGSFDQAIKFGGADGLAQAIYTFGSTPGPVTITASTKAGEIVVEFTAVAEMGTPTSFRSVSGDQQTGVAGTALASPLRVRVTNQYGVGLADVPVHWSTQGTGQVSEASNVTDAQGYAQVSFTLGSEAGPHTVTATAEAFFPVTFTAVATSPPPPAEPAH